MTHGDYNLLLKSHCQSQWKQIGTQRRSGVATPLFSIYSKNSAGIGEIFDLVKLSEWCHKTSMSIIQLLPVNEVGYDFRPYDAQSTFALDPMYLSLDRLVDVDYQTFQNEVKELKKRFPCGNQKHVDYAVKRAKLDVLWKMFALSKPTSKEFESFLKEQEFWIDDFALYKVLKEKNDEKAWEAWPEAEKTKQTDAMQEIGKQFADRILFFKWLQWQLLKQFQAAKKEIAKHQVYLMGDLPFLVSRDSADVWGFQGYFKLDRVAGSPPDAYHSKGQRWGMPPYDWQAIKAHQFDYLTRKLQYASNFYDLYRIDHAVGLFRLWTIPISEPLENGGINGQFEPQQESKWETHGRQLLDVMIQNAMLPCAEDLGTVPACSNPVLQEYGIAGMDVQRWMRHWESDHHYKTGDEYRLNSISVISTHDMSTFCNWWQWELSAVHQGHVEWLCKNADIDFQDVKEKLFVIEESRHQLLRWRFLENHKAFKKEIDEISGDRHELLALFEKSYQERTLFLDYLGLNANEKYAASDLMKKALFRASESQSVFSVQLLQDWLSIDDQFDRNDWEDRINFPGMAMDKNWALTMPYYLEEMLSLKINSKIKQIHQKTDRV